MGKFVKGYFAFIGVIIGIGLFFAVIGFSVEKWEKHECAVLVSQSEEFIGFEATDWQVEQCQEYGVDLSEFLAK